MKLIVGLGNPGRKYQNSRHNAGFMVIDQIMQKAKSKKQNDKAKFKKNEKFNAEICELENDILLVKPQAFMNASGAVVKRLSTAYSLQSAEDIWVIHDDVDIAPGKLKIRMGGSGAGHHGVESIIEALGTDKFLRFRLGIGHPRMRIDDENYKRPKANIAVEDFVLRDFDINERSELKHLLKTTVAAIEVALKKGPEKAMNQFNR